MSNCVFIESFVHPDRNFSDFKIDFNTIEC